MPSSQTITAFYTFSPGGVIRSSEVNSNFSNYRGHILPVDPNTSTAATSGAYDLGASDHYWRYLYAKQLNVFGDTTGATPPAGFYSIYVKSTDGKAYKKDSAGTETQLGGGALVPSGSSVAPNTITAAGGITYTQSAGDRQVIFVIGDTTTGTDITVNPQITAPTTTAFNLELVIVGTDDDRTVLLDDGNGLSMNGPASVANGSMVGFLSVAGTWKEMFRTRC